MRLSFLEYCVTKTLVMGLPSITPSGQVLARCQRSRILECISLEKKSIYNMGRVESLRRVNESLDRNILLLLPR